MQLWFWKRHGLRRFIVSYMHSKIACIFGAIITPKTRFNEDIFRRKPMVEVSLEKSCNGHPDFCKLRFDQFVFPGSHNAGTGQSDGLFTCFFKNHDLNIREQLDFGLRFFDIDTTFR